jgi:uncharacterized protein YbjQ (UPF0145 family)
MDDDRPDTPQAQAPEQSLARIEAGRIPASAERRLRERGGSFTSDLSVADFALCHRLGLRPVSQVMGSSIYQMGYQAASWPTMMAGGMLTELDTVSEAWNEVRSRALARLAEEAAHAGADAVVGVQVRTGEHDWAPGSIEYVALGTAIAREQSSGVGAAPVLTELSVADYAKLLSAGIEPAGIVSWSSVFFATEAFSSQMLGNLNVMQNRELTAFTQGVYGAREIVIARITEQARKLGASGVIGVRIGHSIQRLSIGGGRYERGGLSITFHVIGTAIRQSEATRFNAPELTLNVSG